MFSAGTAFYLIAYAPERAVRKIEGELALGRTVTLIGMKGEPRWSRWRAGQSRSHTVLDDDSTFTVQTWDLALLELVPDPRSRRYRITAQVRHDKSDVAGGVGLYFAHKVYPGNRADIHSFTQLHFNGVRGGADILAVLPDDIRARRPPRGNAVQITSRLYEDGNHPLKVDWKIAGVDGPLFKPFGETNGRWNDLEVTVTPECVTARWNGHPAFAVATAEIEQNVNEKLTERPPPPGNPLSRVSPMKFNLRGGLGLYLWRGSASFRAVTITPS